MLEKKGFTLIELLAVMTILGFVVLLAVPSTINVMEKNKKDSMINDARKIIRVIENTDRKDDYKDTQFVINGKNNKINSRDESVFSSYKAVSVPDVTTSPYGNDYRLLAVQACTYEKAEESIRYYNILLWDGKYYLFGTKGLTTSILNDSSTTGKLIDVNTETKDRYKMVKKSGSLVPSEYLNCRS